MQERERVRAANVAAHKRKASICNIWINLGFRNPYGDKINATARKISDHLSIEIPDGSSPADAVLAWVRVNRGDLLRTARQRRALKAKATTFSGYRA